VIRLAYAAAWALAAPLAVLRLAWRARRQPGYLRHLGERFGRYRTAPPGGPCIWIHAVSVGETRAAVPLVEALLARHPGERILLTHMTPTGRATGESLFGDRVERAWQPYDLRFAVRRFLRHYRPRAGILMEPEIWPRLIEQCAREGVPTLLANARLSQRSAGRYAHFPRLTRWALANLSGIAAQSSADAARFEGLGAHDVTVTGNVKFDLAVPPAMRELGERLRAAFGAARPVWVAGSTREGEEALLLDAFAAMEAPREALLVIVPRHPQRFGEVAALAASRGFATGRRSALESIPAGARVVIGDSMGEMLAYYAAADVVIMGGSLLPYGSQNLIEACALARPVIVGPHTYNFAQASEDAIAAGAAVRATDAAGALRQAAALSANRARLRDMGERAERFVAAHRGAVERLVRWIEPRLQGKIGSPPARG
jgi:3-deoxy-D-manno-octulosonic-acid transferase